MIKKILIGLVVLLEIVFNIVVFAEESEKKEDVVISMVGDMLFDRAVKEQLKNRGDEYLFSGYKKYFDSSTFLFGNLETPLSKRGTLKQGKQYTFRSPPKVAGLLKLNNFSAVTIGNNHVLDYGREAFNDTLKYLKEADLPFSGGGKNIEEAEKPVIIEKNGLKVGFLAFSKVVSYPDWYVGKNNPGVLGAYPHQEKEVIRLVKETKKECDILVVTIHWGTEAVFVLREHDVKLAHKLIDNGVDIVMGHHPHVVQGIEMYKDKPIFYSLGNFIFTMSNKSAGRETLMARVHINDKKNISKIELIPGEIVENRPVPIFDEKRELFIERLNKINRNFIAE